METNDANKLPEEFLNGEMSINDSVKKIGSFIAKNYRIFNLQKYDEDFRSEIIISFLENGEKFLKTYNPDLGDFFSFLYCYINSIITTKLRTLSQKVLKDTLTISEGINNIEEITYKYSKINHHLLEIPKVPYAYKTANVEELKEIFKKLRDENSDKKILVLAMKSSFYLSDNQIEKISKMYDIDVEDFYRVIQFFRENLLSKSEKKIKAQQRRNFAYYHHKRYELQLEKISEGNTENNMSYLTHNIKKKKLKHEKNWEKMNKKLDTGFLYLRPTSKLIADILGICERQVTYYINCAKKEVSEKEKLKDCSN